jgi:hypothetical protein
MSIDSVGVEVVLIRKVELSILISFCLHDGFCIAVSFCLTEGEFAEITGSGVVGSIIRVIITKEVHWKTCELKMAAS